MIGGDNWWPGFPGFFRTTMSRNDNEVAGAGCPNARCSGRLSDCRRGRRWSGPYSLIDWEDPTIFET